MRLASFALSAVPLAAWSLAASTASAATAHVVIDESAGCAVDALARSREAGAPVELHVRLRRLDAGYEGAVTWSGEGATSERVVPGETCDEVVEAVSLLIDVALGLAADEAQEAPRDVPREATKPSVSNWDIEAGAFSRSLLGSFPSPGVTVLASYEPRGRDGVAVRGGVAIAEASASQGSLHVTNELASSVVSACSPQVDTADVALRGCASFEGGVVVSRGRGDGISGTSATSAWWTALGSLELSYPADAKLRGSLVGGARVPLERQRFYVAPDATIYRTPMIGGEFGLSVSVELP